MTPKSLFEVKDKDGGWLLRVVQNAFPAVGDHDRSDHMFEKMQRERVQGHVNFEVPATGHHEVVIESPYHNACTAETSEESVTRLLRAWHSRGCWLRDHDPSMQHVLYFKNNGSVAGASLLHPHSQIVGLPVVSQDVQNQQVRNLRYFEQYGESVFEKSVTEEFALRASGKPHRIIDENEHFVAFIPFAAPSPFNIWIIPKIDTAHFGKSSDTELEACGEILWRSLRRLHIALDEPDWNMVLRSAPLPGRFRQRALDASVFFRWHIIITPRLGA